MSTYDPIYSLTLGSSQSSVTITNIPQYYTDLVLEMTCIDSAAGPNDVYMQFNGDTGTNYSRTYLNTDGSTVTSGRNSTVQYGYCLYIDSTLETGRVDLVGYSNTAIFKPYLYLRGRPNQGVTLGAGAWRSLNPITSILLSPTAGVSFFTGSTFRLYGIRSA